MKQIAIYDLLPLLRKGWVAMGESGDWKWFSHKPNVQYGIWSAETLSENITILFNIKPFDGDWKDSLMECGK